MIDGQQRFTTLSILLAALRNYLKKSDKQIAEQIHEFFLINKYQKNDDVYKVLPTQDDCDAYKSIIDNKIPKAKNKELQSGQIYEAYKFFDSKLKKPLIDDDISLDYTKFKNIILERLVLVNITSDNNDNPYLIFESLNNKGEELTQADLVRNYIFMKLPSEEREEVYNNEWLPVQESFKLNLKQKEYADELTNAFWYYLRKDGEAVNEKAVYKSIKQRFDAAAKHSEKPEMGIKSELQNVIKFINYYLRLNFDEEEQESKLKRWFQRLKKLDFTTCHIFLLNIYIEESLSKERVDTQPMSIEHILPQKSPLHKEWQEMLGTQYNKVHKEWLHTLGNLTLTQYNSELSNKHFKEKLKILTSSNVTLNQYFRKIDVWNEEEIKSRAECLADIAIKVWPR